MAVSNNVFGPLATNLFKGVIDLSSDPVYVALLASYSYSENHATFGAVKTAGAEASGTGYTADGKALTHGGGEVTYSNGTTTFGANAVDTEWAESTINAAFAVVYAFVDDGEGGADDDSPVICVINFDGTESSVDGTFKIEWHNDGIIAADVN